MKMFSRVLTVELCMQIEIFVYFDLKNSHYSINSRFVSKSNNSTTLNARHCENSISAFLKRPTDLRVFQNAVDYDSWYLIIKLQKIVHRSRTRQQVRLFENRKTISNPSRIITRSTYVISFVEDKKLVCYIIFDRIACGSFV